MTDKTKHGGSRKGAGRPKKEETVSLSYRVPKKKANKIREKVKELIRDLVGLAGVIKTFT